MVFLIPLVIRKSKLRSQKSSTGCQSLIVGRIDTFSLSPVKTVHAVSGTAAAYSCVIFEGFNAILLSETHTYSAFVPGFGPLAPNTRSPFLNLVTFSPTDSTSPDTSITLSNNPN